MAQPQPEFKMIGGAKLQQAVLDWSRQSNHLLFAVFGASLLLFATYAEQLPLTWRYQLSTTVGRTLLILLLYIVYLIAGWIPALLFAIGIAITWSNRPLAKPTSVKEGSLPPFPWTSITNAMKVQEGFNSNMKVSEAQNGLWFVEKVLKENPKNIIEDRVDTMAVQDDSSTGNSRTSK
jgi:hypothetical protein